MAHVVRHLFSNGEQLLAITIWRREKVSSDWYRLKGCDRPVNESGRPMGMGKRAEDSWLWFDWRTFDERFRWRSGLIVDEAPDERLSRPMRYFHLRLMQNSTDFHPVHCREIAFLETPEDWFATCSPGLSAVPAEVDNVWNGHVEITVSLYCSEHRWVHTNGNDRCVDEHNGSLVIVLHRRWLVRRKKKEFEYNDNRTAMRTFEKIHDHAFHIVRNGGMSTDIATVSNLRSRSIGWRQILRGDVIRMVMKLNGKSVLDDTESRRKTTGDLLWMQHSTWRLQRKKIHSEERMGLSFVYFDGRYHTSDKSVWRLRWSMFRRETSWWFVIRIPTNDCSSPDEHCHRRWTRCRVLVREFLSPDYLDVEWTVADASHDGCDHFLVYLTPASTNWSTTSRSPRCLTFLLWLLSFNECQQLFIRFYRLSSAQGWRSLGRRWIEGLTLAEK